MKTAEQLAEFATTLTLEDVPEDVARHAKLHLLDTLGCGLAAHATGVAGEGREAMAELGGEPQATVIGHDTALYWRIMKDLGIAPTSPQSALLETLR